MILAFQGMCFYFLYIFLHTKNLIDTCKSKVVDIYLYGDLYIATTPQSKITKLLQSKQLTISPLTCSMICQLVSFIKKLLGLSLNVSLLLYLYFIYWVCLSAYA
jgi:hypothetical protein